MFYEFTTDTIEPINCWKDVWDVELLIGGSLFASIEDYSLLNREELLSKLTNELQNDKYINNDAVQLSVSKEWLKEYLGRQIDSILLFINNFTSKKWTHDEVFQHLALKADVFCDCLKASPSFSSHFGTNAKKK